MQIALSSKSVPQQATSPWHAMLNTAAEAAFETIGTTTLHVCDAAIVLLGRADTGRQWFIPMTREGSAQGGSTAPQRSSAPERSVEWWRCGVDNRTAVGAILSGIKSTVDFAVKNIPPPSIWSYTLYNADLRIISDASRDAYFAADPLRALFPHIHFFAGVPIGSQSGYPFGTMWIMDHAVRELSPSLRAYMQSLGHQLAIQIELRLKIAEREGTNTGEHTSKAICASSIADTPIAGGDLPPDEDTQPHRPSRKEQCEGAWWGNESPYRTSANMQVPHIAVLDRSGTIIAVNNAWEHFALENGTEDLRHVGIGINYFDICNAVAGPDAAEAQIVAHSLRRVLDGSLPQFTLEYPCHSPEKERWFILTITPLTAENGGALVSHMDITGHKQTELALYQSDLHFSKIFNASPVAASITTLAEGRFIDANEGYLRLLGYQRDDIIGRTDMVRQIWVEYSDYEHMVATLHRRHLIRDMEIRFRTKSGETREGLVSAARIDLTGQACALTMLHDITEHKQHERELTAFVKMSTALRAAPDRAAMIPIILDLTERLLATEGSALLTFDPSRNSAYIERGCGQWAIYTGMHIFLGVGWSKQSIAADQVCPDAPAQHDSRIVPAELCSGMRTVAYVPLVPEEQPIGMVYIGRKKKFAHSELRLLTIIGDIAATALNRATLHEEMVLLYGQLDSRERFITRVLESIPSSLVVLDRAMRVVSANRNFLDKARREERNTLGYGIEDVFPPAIAQYTRLRQKVREVFRTGQAVMGGKVAYRAPGLPTHIYYYRLIPIKRDEKVENVILFMDDITERERLEEEVRLAERHLASVVECANDLVVSLDCEGRVVTWNLAAEYISGFKVEQIQGKSLVSLCPVDQRALMEQMLSLLVHGKAVQHTEINLLTSDHQAIPIAWSCSPMLSDLGDVIGIVAVGRDLTERRRLEAQLIQSAKMASLGVMAGGIAHELRNPLGIISASAQLLIDHIGNFQLHNECAQRIHIATKRASLIIENLLKFARPMSERMHEVDVNIVIEETFVLLTHQLSHQQVDLRKDLQPELPRVHGNPALLQQVFTNLILNACNAMSYGGVLTVITREIDMGQVEIVFKDTGHGIAPENLTRIFDPFFTTMPVGKGTGLGLSISYSIIQQHNGIIEATSQVGQGAAFVIRLPGILGAEA